MTQTAPILSTVALVAKPGDAAVDDSLRELVAHLTGRGVGVLVEERVADRFGAVPAAPLIELGGRADLVIVVGGDGTLLHAARELAASGVRILGVNRGRLGFLADISHDQMLDAVDRILAGDFEEDPRFMLTAEIRDGGGTLRAESRALNDVVIHKWNTARMIEFETWIDGRFVETQRSDGMIVSTPTGSTAYAMSGGGPLISPDLNVILLVPICPHTLSNRPIVVGGDAVLELRVSERNEAGHVHITCDGQNTYTVGPEDRVTLCRAGPPVRLIHPAGHDHFEILRGKLGWGGNRH